MSAQPVDVLAHLASMALAYGEKWGEIHNAVAELIEADKEYDAAKDFLAEQRRNVGAIHVAEARWNKAVARRRAALARCGGQP